MNQSFNIEKSQIQLHQKTPSSLKNMAVFFLGLPEFELKNSYHWFFKFFEWPNLRPERFSQFLHLGPLNFCCEKMRNATSRTLVWP